jgi:hypothetical protein
MLQGERRFSASYTTKISVCRFRTFQQVLSERPLPLFTWLSLLLALLTFLRLTGPIVDGGASWISRAPSVMYLISMYSLKMELVPGPRGELNTLRIEVEGASQQGSDLKRPHTDTKNRRSPVAIVAGYGSSKAALNKTFGISLHSPDTLLVKRWFHALTRCRVNAGSSPASGTSPQFHPLKRSSTMQTSLQRSFLQTENRENGQLCDPERRDAIVSVPSALRRAPTHNNLVR